MNWNVPAPVFTKLVPSLGVTSPFLLLSSSSEDIALMKFV